jgi:hypothetical protein
MTLPHPSIIRQRCMQVRARLEDKDLPSLYRLAHNFAYEKIKTETVTRKGSGPSNPTQDAAVYEASRRRKLQKATDKLQRHLDGVETCIEMIEGCLPDSNVELGEPDPMPDAGDRYRREGQANQRKRAMFPWNPDSSEVV